MSCQKQLLIVDLGITDPYLNLAVEEYLYDNLSENTLVLILWQNENTVVIGLNQSVFSQCNLDELKAHEVNIARRKSGGGAVYHDLGNLNYTFISRCYDKVCEDNMKTVAEALLNLGIHAELSGRNDISVCGRKISGNAFYRDDTRICHHGTLLINVDLPLMYRLLNVDPLKWKDKGIESAGARTVNLKDINESVSVDAVKQSLVDTVCAQNSDAEIRYLTQLSDNEFDVNAIESLAGKYSSTDWIFGKKLNETLRIKERFSWGTVEVQLVLDNNIVADCAVYSDAMETRLFRAISDRVKSAEFSRQALEKALKMSGLSKSEQEILADITKLIAAETAY